MSRAPQFQITGHACRRYIERIRPEADMREAGVVLKDAALRAVHVGERTRHGDLVWRLDVPPMCLITKHDEAMGAVCVTVLPPADLWEEVEEKPALWPRAALVQQRRSPASKPEVKVESPGKAAKRSAGEAKQRAEQEAAAARRAERAAKHAVIMAEIAARSKKKTPVDLAEEAVAAMLWPRDPIRIQEVTARIGLPLGTGEMAATGEALHRLGWQRSRKEVEPGKYRNFWLAPESRRAP